MWVWVATRWVLVVEATSSIRMTAVAVAGAGCAAQSYCCAYLASVLDSPAAAAATSTAASLQGLQLQMLLWEKPNPCCAAADGSKSV